MSTGDCTDLEGYDRLVVDLEDPGEYHLAVYFGSTPREIESKPEDCLSGQSCRVHTSGSKFPRIWLVFRGPGRINFEKEARYCKVFVHQVGSFDFQYWRLI